jgi:hypothetical protein
MFPTIDLDPDAAASALDELANELRSTPSILTTREDLSCPALAEMEDIVTRWATEYGLPAACVPERPVPAELTVERALLFLRELAAVIRYVAANVQPFGTMKNVVARLQSRNDKALSEIVDLEHAMTEVGERWPRSTSRLDMSRATAPGPMRSRRSKKPRGRCMPRYSSW